MRLCWTRCETMCKPTERQARDANTFMETTKMSCNIRNIKRAVNRLICRIFGHKRCTVLVERSRVERKNASWKNCKVKMVRGIYTECARCGKKLSDFKRVKNDTE